MTKTTDLYWLAGLLEGEGSFQIRRGNAIVVSLGMTDEDIIQRAAQYFGKPIYKEERPAGYKTVYRTQCYGQHAMALMMTVYPLMGKRRQKQIKNVLLQAYGRPGRARGERNGRSKLTEQDVLEIRKRGLRKPINKSALGREFGVSGNQVNYILKKKSWAHV